MDEIIIEGKYENGSEDDDGIYITLSSLRIHHKKRRGADDAEDEQRHARGEELEEIVFVSLPEFTKFHVRGFLSVYKSCTLYLL